MKEARTLGHWFDSFMPEEDGPTAIRYIVDLNEHIQGLEFYIVILENNYEFEDGTRQVTITKALSRRYPDEEMNNLMAIIADDKNSAKVAQLVDSVWDTRSHITKSTGIWPRAIKTLDSKYGIVSYINTDLNDFGKGNDLRETPKDITGDFIGEVIKRLEIPFSVPMEGSYNEIESKEAINAHLERILDKYPHFGPAEKGIKPILQILECRYSMEEKEFRFYARRRDQNSTVPLDYMSAGENE